MDLFSCMKKSGQISIFIIISILIAASVILIFVSVKKINPPSAKGDAVYIYVQDCLDKISKRAVLNVAKQGGYYSFSEINNIYYFPYSVPLYVDKETKNVPAKEIVEGEINNYIENDMDSCLKDFEEFKKNGFEIEMTKFKVNSEIKDESVVIDAESDLIVSRNDVNEEFKKFGSEIKKIKILRLLELSNEIATEQVKSSGSICFNCLDDLAEKYEIKIKIIDTENVNEFVYILSDGESLVDKEDLRWIFGARYDFPECKSAEECLNEI